MCLKKQIVNYEYAINDYYGNEQSKKETIDWDTAVGEYKTLLPDGRRQTVTYDAGPNGYLANVAYDESKDTSTYAAPAPAPSTVSYATPAPEMVYTSAPMVEYATPAPVTQVYMAPVTEAPAPVYTPAPVYAPAPTVAPYVYSKSSTQYVQMTPKYVPAPTYSAPSYPTPPAPTYSAPMTYSAPAPTYSPPAPVPMYSAPMTYPAPVYSTYAAPMAYPAPAQSYSVTYAPAPTLAPYVHSKSSTQYVQMAPTYSAPKSYAPYSPPANYYSMPMPSYSPSAPSTAYYQQPMMRSTYG